MGANSKIEWTNHTFNPWWGCEKISPGCTHCYAATLDKRVGGDHWSPAHDRRFFGEKHWNEPLKWELAAINDGATPRVFCASMADVFEDLPLLINERGRLFKLIENTPHLLWLLLTKRPENMIHLAPDSWREKWPHNICAMTTVENQEFANKRIPELLRVPATLRGISYEPALGPVNLNAVLGSADVGCLYSGVKNEDSGLCVTQAHIDWVICGGESGPGARPMHPDWARSARDQCQAAGVKYFFKQWGEYGPVDFEKEPNGSFNTRAFDTGLENMERMGKKAAGRELDGRTWDEFPETAKVATL